jgi:hypothetical protein
MARLTHGGENIGFRESLIEYAETVLIPVMNSSETFMASVPQLKTGGEYQLRRYELPDAHPVGDAGELHHWLVLGADDVLRRG